MKLAIDPGHGMGNSRTGIFDPGAEAGGLREADLTLMLALTVKFVLEEEGIPCLLLRTDNTKPAPLRTRPTVADAAGCTHYLCLHVNDADDPAVGGFEILYRSQEDYEFGKGVHTAALAAFAMHDRGMKPESDSQHSHLRVFDFPGPVAYVELGFIQNVGDMAMVRNRARRIRFAEYLAAYLFNLSSHG